MYFYNFPPFFVVCASGQILGSSEVFYDKGIICSLAYCEKNLNDGLGWVLKPFLPSQLSNFQTLPNQGVCDGLPLIIS